MISNFESIGVERVSYGFMSRKRKVLTDVRVMRLDRGGEPFVLLADADCRLLAVCARSGFGNFSKLMGSLSFSGRASPCPTLANCLGAGHVVASHAAAEWMSREAKLLTEIKPHVQKILGGGIQ